MISCLSYRLRKQLSPDALLGFISRHFRPWYQREEFKGTIITFMCTNFKERERPEFTEQENKKYVRWHAVMNHLPQMPGKYKNDIRS